MAQQHLFLIVIILTSLLMVEMYIISNNLEELQRYQRGFGNRRALVIGLKHHYPKEFLFGSDKDLFSNPDESIEEDDLFNYGTNHRFFFR
jgi:hypothetical protein